MEWTVEKLRQHLKNTNPDFQVSYKKTSKTGKTYQAWKTLPMLLSEYSRTVAKPKSKSKNFSVTLNNGSSHNARELSKMLKRNNKMRVIGWERSSIQSDPKFRNVTFPVLYDKDLYPQVMPRVGDHTLTVANIDKIMYHAGRRRRVSGIWPRGSIWHAYQSRRSHRRSPFTPSPTGYERKEPIYHKKPKREMKRFKIITNPTFSYK